MLLAVCALTESVPPDGNVSCPPDTVMFSVPPLPPAADGLTAILEVLRIESPLTSLMVTLPPSPRVRADALTEVTPPPDELRIKDRRMPALTYTQFRNARKILGVRLDPANKKGLRSWRLPQDWEVRLERAGLKIC